MDPAEVAQMLAAMYDDDDLAAMNIIKEMLLNERTEEVTDILAAMYYYDDLAAMNIIKEMLLNGRTAEVNGIFAIMDNLTASDMLAKMYDDEDLATILAQVVSEWRDGVFLEGTFIADDITYQAGRIGKLDVIQRPNLAGAYLVNKYMKLFGAHYMMMLIVNKIVARHNGEQRTLHEINDITMGGQQGHNSDGVGMRAYDNSSGLFMHSYNPDIAADPFSRIPLIINNDKYQQLAFDEPGELVTENINETLTLQIIRMEKINNSDVDLKGQVTVQFKNGKAIQFIQAQNDEGQVAEQIDTTIKTSISIELKDGDNSKTIELKINNGKIKLVEEAVEAVDQDKLREKANDAIDKFIKQLRIEHYEMPKRLLSKIKDVNKLCDIDSASQNKKEALKSKLTEIKTALEVAENAANTKKPLAIQGCATDDITKDDIEVARFALAASLQWEPSDAEIKNQIIANREKNIIEEYDKIFANINSLKTKIEELIQKTEQRNQNQY